MCTSTSTAFARFASMLFNETWEGELFVGDKLTVQGSVNQKCITE